MNSFIKSIVLIFSVVAITACQQGGGINKQTGGTLIGGVAGGLLGSQFGKGEGRLIATGVGALAGALVGGSVGQSLDQYDKELLERSSRQALEFSPSGSTVEWQNPDSGHRGTVTPTKTFKNNSGMYCREYQQAITIGGETKKGFGTACRQPDGSWQIVK